MNIKGYRHMMDITLGMVGETPVLHLSGRLDAMTSPLLEERLQPILNESNAGHRVLFDCSGLTYVSSAGLRVFLLAQREMSGRGGGVAFGGVVGPVLDLFRLAGLDAVLPIAPSVEEAARLLGAH